MNVPAAGHTLGSKEAWREWVLSEPTAVPAHLDRATYDEMSDDERERYDDVRFLHHSALVLVETPALRRIHHAITRKLRENSAVPPGARQGIIVDGIATAGKSTAVTSFGRNYELSLRRKHPDLFGRTGDEYIPVVYLSVPSGASPKALSVALAMYLNLPMPKRANMQEHTSLVLEAFRRCGTTLVIIDDVHNLTSKNKDATLAINHLKHLANLSAATYIYAGVDCQRSAIFSEGGEGHGLATQTSGRFTVYKLGRFPLATKADKEQWASIVMTLEKALCLLNHEPGSLLRDWEHLYQRTRGSISSLAGLIRASAAEAMLSGTEAITRKTLDEIPTDNSTQQEYEREIEKRVAKAKMSLSSPTSAVMSKEQADESIVS